MLKHLLAFTVLFTRSLSLDNGLARTPPMGWITWQRYRCQIDCMNYPEDCISQTLVELTADRLVEDGWRDVGYRYLIIDDCWPAMRRDRNTYELVADTSRFPKGIQHIGQYLHAKGLLFGIYLDYGTYTCAGYPGSMDYLKVDAQSLATWNIDYVKVDGCYSSPTQMPGGYEEFGRYLNQTGRPMVYSCSYPAYTRWQTNSSLIDWERLKRNCNLWRMLGDIDDSWESVLNIINTCKEQQIVLQPLAGAGHWNDPDMLILGNFGLSKDQQRVQMGMWCMLAAPLLISANMDNIDPFSAELLRNPHLISINQDVGGHQAKFIKEMLRVQLWMRELENKSNAWAIAFMYPVSGGGPIHVLVTLKDFAFTTDYLQPSEDVIYILTDVFDGTEFGVVKLTENFKVHVNPTGISMFHVQAKKYKASESNAIEIQKPL